MRTSGERISFPAPDGTCEAHLACPEGPGPHPGVLLYMDAIGLRPQIEEIADRIATWGYVVLAPNVFYRDGTSAEIAPKTDLREPEAREKFFPTVMPMLAAHTADRAARDFECYLALLDATSDVAPGAIGITGYCMGGRLALRAAAQQPDRVAAIGMFHTGGLVTEADDSPHTCITRVRAQVLSGYADKDRSMPESDITTMNASFDAAGVQHYSTTRPGAPHGYTMADTSMFNHEASEWHFTELRNLFARCLGTERD
ncbi:dienelactone hydrolase family protein [Nocardioides sp. BGMRC 2183]|nr:dienelactone hydrolase family protein [Nocardioides sp. BGMRC 2183]